MKVNGKDYRTIWMEGSSVFLIDQTLLPFDFRIYEAKNYLDTCWAIKNMLVRGAPAIGAAAGFALAQAFIAAPEDNFFNYVEKAKRDIEATRPTAKNLFYAANRVFSAARESKNSSPVVEFGQVFWGAKHLRCRRQSKFHYWVRKTAFREAQKIVDESVDACKKIGEYGNELIKDGFNVETHCNAGWLACVDYGTALSPIYNAHRNGKNVFVYVGETRPRNQGARITAWELKNEGIPYVILPDSAGAYLMSQGKVDLFIVGADRIAKNGDVANKIGTLEKAIAAKEFGVPFFVAAPCSTVDLNCGSGKDIPIEERSEDEVLYQTGLAKDGNLEKILVSAPHSKAINPAFDVTPAKYIAGIITEKGIIKPNETSIKNLCKNKELNSEIK